jgi:hypothetical protein
LRLLADVVVLYMASSAALFADASIRASVANRWLAVLFPMLVLMILHARRSPDGRFCGSLGDSSGHVFGAVSIATILTIALDAIIGGPPVVGASLRLWLFAVVYL